MMMIVAGYVITFAYVFFLIFILGSFIRKHTTIEVSRKVIHTMLFMVWVFIDIFFKHTIHQVILPVTFLLLNSLSYKFKIYKSVEREDQNHFGTVYFAIAIVIVMAIALWIPELYLPTGIAAFSLTVGDGFAALIGYNFKSPKIRENKSILGMGACFAASAVALFIFRLIYWPQLEIGDILLIAAVAAVLELTSNGLDNLTITFGTFALSYLLVFVDHTAVQYSMMWAVLVFGVVFFSHAINYNGSLLAMGIVFVFRYYGGRIGLTYLLGTYFTDFVIAIVRKHVSSVELRKKSSGRGFIQILVNGGPGTLCMILFGLTNELWLFWVSITAIGGSFIDSISSDIGGMARQKPYDFLRHTEVENGISGGMTTLGTTSSAIFSIIIAIFVCLAAKMSIWPSLLIGILSFMQTLIDTVMGSLLQVKYRCAICAVNTEKQEHCGVTTVYCSGVRWIDNNVVNLFSSLSITLLAAIILRSCL